MFTPTCDNCGSSPIDPDECLCNRCKYPTCAQLEAKGIQLRGTYRGPFCLEDAKKILSDLEQTQAFHRLRIVSQGDGFNVVEQL